MSPRSCLSVASALLCAAVVLGAAPAETDLDAFMKQVVARRDDNWKKLQQYIFDEREQIELRGPGHAPLWGERREYTWYIRDGFFVRSPLKFNGVAIGESDRRSYEDSYLKRMKARDKRCGRGTYSAGADGPDHQSARPCVAAPSDAPAEPAAGQVPPDVDGLIRQTRQPQFISSAYFLRFKF